MVPRHGGASKLLDVSSLRTKLGLSLGEQQHPCMDYRSTSFCFFRPRMGCASLALRVSIHFRFLDYSSVCYWTRCSSLVSNALGMLFTFSRIRNYGMMLTRIGNFEYWIVYSMGRRPCCKRIAWSGSLALAWCFGCFTRCWFRNDSFTNGTLIEYFPVKQ